MRPALLRFTLTAASAMVAPFAQAEISLPQLQGLIALEETKSGSLLPFPVEGRPGQITETEIGFEVRYEALFTEGFGLLEPVFIIQETAPDLLSVELSSYRLDDQLNGAWESMGAQLPLPTFAGDWSVQDETYVAYQIDAPFGFSPAPGNAVSGFLSLTTATGDDALINLSLDGLNITSNGEPMANLDALDLDITATDLDPYGLTNSVFELIDRLANSNDPSAAMGLLPAYTNLLLGSEGQADLSLSGLSFDGPGMGGTLDTASLSLSKTGQNMIGAQGVKLSLSAANAEARQTFGYGEPYQTFGFESLSLDQEISVENVLGSIAQGASLFGVFARGEDPDDLPDFALTVGRFLDTLAPRIAASVSLEGAYQSSDVTRMENNLQSAAVGFVFDLRDEIRFEGSVIGLDSETNSEWSRTVARADVASFVSGYRLWDTFVSDTSNLIAQSLALGEEFGGRAPYGPLSNIGFAGLGAISQSLNFAGYAEANATNVHFAERTDWDSFGFALDALAYRQGAEARDGGSRWNLDAAVDTLIVAQSYADDPLFFSRGNLQALAAGGGQDLIFALDSATQDLDLDTKPWGPFFDTLLGLIAQGRQISEPSYEAYRPLIREAALATLNQFDGIAQRAEINGLQVPAYEGEYSWDNRPGVALGSAGMNLVWNRDQVAYFLGLQDFVFDRCAMDDLPSASLQSALLESSNPAMPDGFGVDMVDYYLNTLDMALDPSGTGLMSMTWGDYLDTVIYDVPYSEASASIQGLSIDLIQNHLRADLADLTMISGGSVQADPPAYDLGYRVSWSGLETMASLPEAAAYLSALLPEQGVMDLSLVLGLKPEGQDILATLPMIDLSGDDLKVKQDQARALATLDLDLQLREIFARSAAWQLEGQADFLPEVEANPEGLEDWWQPIFEALIIEPNLDGSLRLTGLERLEAAQQKVLSAKSLGPLEFVREIARDLGRTTNYLRSLGAEDNGTLTYELSMGELGDLMVNGQSVL